MKRMKITLPVTLPLGIVYVVAVFCMGVGAAEVGEALAAWWTA